MKLTSSNKKVVSKNDVLKMVKSNCPKGLLGLLPSDEVLEDMIEKIAKMKGRELK